MFKVLHLLEHKQWLIFQCSIEECRGNNYDILFIQEVKSSLIKISNSV